MKILAIESSCDETAIAVIEDGKVLSNVISTQIDIHKEYGGVVPEIASRHHIENIIPVFEESLNVANTKINEIDYIAVTNTPGLIGSLLVGVMFAKALSYANNIPLIMINHIEGHIFSNFIDTNIEFPAVSLIISGGHTNLYYIDKVNENINIELLGETLDDAVGEIYDKIARILNLKYPGGPKIDKLSLEGEDILKIKMPTVEGYNFSFSGIKTSITNYVNNLRMKGNEIKIEDISKSLQVVVSEYLSSKVKKVIKEKNVKTILVAGGVAANQNIRKKFIEEFEEKGLKLYFPKLEYCTDNGAMIGMAAYYKIKNIENDKKYKDDAISTKTKKQLKR